ncbi:divergent PAP2 family protein [Metabacillus fastidiosus]|uniref:divergent PAP2 family protein n=1 Tax=Metabacillus fastidiosus TaxID=1458 RepID=UPI002DB9F60C|nr:divergent PAP2 family protein [Metabacillus fastidiosus]MEC2077381.1 divergent PAP2 family protein [Metabacillus fastidiosus]
MKKMGRGIWTSLLAIGAAQGLKVFTYKSQIGKWDWRPIFQTGGMPSSHSAGVSALAAYIAAKKGWNSTETALAVIFGVIVMYDAQGIRRHTGEIAKIVNDLDADIELLSGHAPGLFHVRREEELNELLGHQPAEVAGGALLGAGIGLISALTKKKK